MLYAISPRCFFIGLAFFIGIGSIPAFADEGASTDVQQKIAELTPKANAGDISATNQLAKLYDRKLHDYARAMALYRKAADGGNAEAMTSVGSLYSDGNGVTQDYAEARDAGGSVLHRRGAGSSMRPTTLDGNTSMGTGWRRTPPRRSNGIARPPMQATAIRCARSDTSTSTASARRKGPGRIAQVVSQAPADAKSTDGMRGVGWAYFKSLGRAAGCESGSGVVAVKAANAGNIASGCSDSGQVVLCRQRRAEGHFAGGELDQ